MKGVKFRAVRPWMMAFTAASLTFLLFSFVTLSVFADPNEDLLRAVEKGDLKAVRTALDKGADINTIGYEGQTALKYAEEGGYTDIVRILKEAGAQ